MIRNERYALIIVGTSYKLAPAGVDMSGNNYFGSKIYVNSQYCIDSIHIESWGHHQYEKTYKYKNFSLDNFTYHHIDNLREKNDKMDNIRRKKEGLPPIL